MLALVERSDYVNGQDVGVKKDSFCLNSGFTGYRIIGDYDDCSGTMRVVRHYDMTLIGGCLAEYASRTRRGVRDLAGCVGRGGS